MAIKLIDPETSISEISGALLKLAKLYQMKDFDDINALLLAEWTVEKFKHKPLGIIINALTDPPTIYEDGAIVKSWRLTPETIKAWIDQRCIELEELRIKKESEAKQIESASECTKLSEDTLKMINEVKSDLMDKMNPKKIIDIHAITPMRPKENSYAVGYPHTPADELRKKELHIQWIRENIDPITQKPLPNYQDETTWLNLIETKKD